MQGEGCEGVAITWAQARRPGALMGALSGGSQEALAPHLAARLAARQMAQGRNTALRALPTTLDARLQRVALAALRRQLSELRGRDVEDGAVVVLDKASGEVLAWVGSSGSMSSAADVDAVLARRQPGSTLKPFVYALALQQRLLTAASLLDDAPLQMAAGANLYQPQNYDHRYKGLVPVRAALAGSLNVPAVRVAAMLGPDNLFDGLNRTGLRLSESGGYHGLALALGSADVSLLDLSNAYRMLANAGVYSPVRWQPSTARATPRAVIEPAVAFIVSDILADPAARAATFGLDSPLVTRGWASVKTGTSKDMRDNWCVGSSSRYTVGVWVGNASGAPMHGVSGISGAAPVWQELMAYLHALQGPSKPPVPPAGLVNVAGEWYLAGTEPTASKGPASQGVAQAFGIQSPREGTVVLLDPDIPMAAQRMVFEGAAGRWLIDGREIGSGTQLRWLPLPGRHVLERRVLLAKAKSGGAVALDEPTDRVSFEVRAALPPPRLHARR
jgi:penicillin-binding protein 1C